MDTIGYGGSATLWELIELQLYLSQVKSRKVSKPLRSYFSLQFDGLEVGRGQGKEKKKRNADTFHIKEHLQQSLPL